MKSKEKQRSFLHMRRSMYMIELLFVVLKILAMLIIGSVIYTAVFAWDVSDLRSLKLRKRGEKMIEQLMTVIFAMIVLFIFILGGIKCLMQTQ